MSVQTRYIEAVGRRKTAIARVRIIPGDKATFSVNGREAREYFKTDSSFKSASDSFNYLNTSETFSISAKVLGGGFSAQAEAIRLGLSRALVKYNQDFKSPLKKEGFLKRDPRSIERKKPGLKKARKRPAWSKR